MPSGYKHVNLKSTSKWPLTCFKNILKSSYSNYFNSNLPMRFTILLKISLLFNSFYCIFCNKTLVLDNIKTITAMNVKNLVFVICVVMIIYICYYIICMTLPSLIFSFHGKVTFHFWDIQFFIFYTNPSTLRLVTSWWIFSSMDRVRIWIYLWNRKSSDQET